jgi:putative resolvase
VNRLLGIKPVERKKERERSCTRVSPPVNRRSIYLTSQVKRLRSYAEEKGYEIVKVYEEEAASGLNENRRRKLQSAYGMLREKKADLVLVEFKDRLSRFGFNYLKALAESYGASVEVVNGDVKKDAMQELVG